MVVDDYTIETVKTTANEHKEVSLLLKALVDPFGGTQRELTEGVEQFELANEVVDEYLDFVH